MPQASAFDNPRTIQVSYETCTNLHIPLTAAMGAMLLAWLVLSAAVVAQTTFDEIGSGREGPESLVAAGGIEDVAVASTNVSGSPAPVDIELPLESRAWSLLAERLPEGFGVHAGPRSAVASDVADPAVVAAHAAWVERAMEEFDRFARECGLTPQPLRHKLVAVLFEKRDQYQTFAHIHDGVNDPTLSGYYSPRNDRAVFCLADESTAEGEPQRQTPNVGGKVGEARCVHETIHQLTFSTGLMNPRVQYPMWISEGLATVFETEDAQQPFGPDCAYAPRRDAFARLLERNELIPLAGLVTVVPASAIDLPRQRAVYNQSYALVAWMCAQRKAELREYLNAMLDEPPGSLPAQRHLEMFEEAFGPVDQLESAWLAAERTK